MAKDSATSGGTITEFDKWQTIAVAIFMALVGYTVMVSVPELSTALVQKAGFTEVQVGRIWGADLLGLSIGAIFAAFTVAQMNRRLLVMLGVVLAVGANALCLVLVEYEQVYALRIAAGIGSGIFTAVAVVTLGGTTKPVIAFNILLFGFAFSTAAELRFIPTLTMNEVYIFFIVLAVLCAVFIRWIPARPLNEEELTGQEEGEVHVEDWHVPKILPILCLVAVCFTYINIGGYYTYIDLAALGDGVDETWTGNALQLSSLFAIVGCILAYFATRFGLFKPLFISLFAMAAIVIMLSAGINKINIVISLLGFMTLWTFVDVYQMAMLSHMDRAGSLVALLPSVQGFGQFLGPNLAASVLAASVDADAVAAGQDVVYDYGMVFTVSGSMAFVAMVIYIFISLFVRKRDAVAPEHLEEGARRH